jgi:nucleoside-diphosphate-sugar epimerase
MSVLIGELLRRLPETEVVALDIAPFDAAAAQHFAPFGDRLIFRRCDVRDAAEVRRILVDAQPGLVVHGATVTHVSAWEHERPHPFVDVNVSGTLNVLEAVRAAGSARRVVHVSSCAVYGHGDPDAGTPLQSEAGPFRPADLYGIGKLGGELVARRFSELHGLPVSVVRPTRVFGPMERPTSARKVMHLPHLLVSRMLAGLPVRITRRSVESVGDWISVEDLAGAHVATGRPIAIPELLSLFPVAVEWVEEGTGADADFDPALRHGQHAVYDISVIRDDTGWAPRPFAAQVASYLAWARANPSVFAECAAA